MNKQEELLEQAQKLNKAAGVAAAAMKSAVNANDKGAYSKAYSDFIAPLQLPLTARAGDNRETYTLYSPVNGTSLGEYARTDSGEIDGIVKSARAAHEVLTKLPWETRLGIIESFATVSEQLNDAIALAITANMGKSLKDARGEMGKAAGWADFAMSPEVINYIKNYKTDGIKTGWHVRDKEGKPITSAEQLTEVVLFTEYPAEVSAEALDSMPDGDIKGNGICVSMPPANYTFALGVGDIYLSMLVGNSCIIKPPSQTPDPESIFSHFFNQHAANYLEERKDELNLNEGDVAAVREGAVQMANVRGLERYANNLRFVGGMHAGLAVHANHQGSEDNNDDDKKRHIFELAGDNPMFIGGSIQGEELKTAADKLLARVSSNSGMICTRINCSMIQSGETFDKFSEISRKAFADYTKNWKDHIGNPLDLDTAQGALTNRAEYEKMKTYLDEVREIVGSENIIGGELVMEDTGGVYVTPALVIWPDDKKDEYRKTRAKGVEIFGPITNMMAVDDVDEAADITNESHNNLSCSVWTHDPQETVNFLQETGLGSYNFLNPKHGSDNAPFGEHMARYENVPMEDGSTVTIENNGPTGGLAHVAHHFNIVPQNPLQTAWIKAATLKEALLTLIGNGVDLRRDTSLGDTAIKRLNDEHGLTLP